ncbi:hypothetical protein ACFWBF_20035 [Streptomyces sp. NPDC060028]|uniref:hypothetical protein n=1 Tax=Streptomyces sp. NPDC060028 TaxID=3347041 RepID=UPI00367F8B6B
MSVTDSALRESLKSLRLSGMLETLDARLAQAHGGELGHLDFLQVLCQDEITRHQVIMNGLSYRPNERPESPTDKPAKPTIT